MKRKTAFYMAAAVIFILAGACALLLPYARADCAMPEEGSLFLRQREDGALLLDWSRTKAAKGYLVEILREPEGGAGKNVTLFSGTVDSLGELLLPELPEDEPLIFRVRAVAAYRFFGKELTRAGTSALEARTALDMPEVNGLRWNTIPEESAVTVEFRMNSGDNCRVYRQNPDGDLELLEILEDTRWTASFGGDLPMPEGGAPCRLAFAASREIPGMVLQGAVSAEISVYRQDLLNTQLHAVFEPVGQRAFRVTWDETKGDWYEVRQILEDGSTRTLFAVSGDGERSYTSDTLGNGREYAFQVVALGGLTPENSFVAARSQVYMLETDPSPIYATVWPIRDLKAYRDPQKTAAVALAKAGRACCVAAEENDMFGVRIGDQICYIDSQYCMINLPEYLGGLCSYEIANSSKSRFMIHEFEIPDVTGQVIPGYQCVQQADGSYLVPLLYPTAKKLLCAAQDAVSRGYRLKIYDAFRPQFTTGVLYDRTKEILDMTVPGKTYTGAQPELSGGGTGKLTYRRVMTNGIYSLNHFLAEGMSRHNLGVALDLTLEDPDTAVELRMQSAMHDLSWYSVTGRNNDNARLLESVMKAAGFAGLSSEWWHFQDDKIMKQLSLTPFRDGVSAEGWACDNNGWRYRDGSGNYYRNQTAFLDGIEYSFDENGYQKGIQAGFG